MSETLNNPRPVLAAEPTSWVSLPIELRHMILSLVSLPARVERSDRDGSPRTARYAAVSREWQLFFEARTFRRLVLGTDPVDAFRAIVERDSTRLGYIRKLWLRVQLPRYDCRDCDAAEDEATRTRYVRAILPIMFVVSGSCG